MNSCATAARTGPASSSISTSCATTIQAFAKALPDSRVFYAVKANPAPELLRLLALARLLLRHRLGRRDRDGARRPAPRRTASRSATRSRRSATSRAPIALGVRLFAVDCKAEVEKIARAAPGAKVFCRFLFDCAGAEWPLSRKFGCDPGDGGRRARARPSARARGLWRVVPCRLAAAPHPGLGRGAEVGGGDLPRLRGARDQPLHGQSRRRLSDQVPQGGAGGGAPTAARSSARCASTSATASRRPSSSRDAAWSAMPA